MRSRSTTWPNLSIWMSWNLACKSSMFCNFWFFSFFLSRKSRWSCLWLALTSRISWCSSVMRDMSRPRPSRVKTTWLSSSGGRRSCSPCSRHCTWERRRAKTISTWLSLRCLSVWKCWISASVCFCSLSMRRSSSRSFLCVFFSSSTAFWISCSASSMSRRFSRKSTTPSYICTSQPCGGPTSSSISSSSSSLSRSLSSSSSSSSSSKSSSSPRPFLRFERLTFFLYTFNKAPRNGEFSPTSSVNSACRFCSSLCHCSISAFRSPN
mmetsp:Transcript_93074/g.247215  ORF Transcript_93074/g.247215 Transcript_93074/m.247215 type:complete len:266 (+) Transcript_93074:593-1390(+)